MQVTFRTLAGHPELGINMFWQWSLTSASKASISETLIPELFYDFIYVHRGRVRFEDQEGGDSDVMSGQYLRLLHTRPLILHINPPAVLMGARFHLRFAEQFDLQTALESGQVIFAQNWLRQLPRTLAQFANAVTSHLRDTTHSASAHMLTDDLEETTQLLSYSLRHRSRMFKRIFGINLKQLHQLQKLHRFLAQDCGFAVRSAIIEHIDAVDFHDQAHLNHMVKHLTGLSPRQVIARKSVLQDYLMSASYNAFAA
jgi:AraC-like DNA-binding protein